VGEDSPEQNRKVGICGQAPSDYPDFASFLVKEGFLCVQRACMCVCACCLLFVCCGDVGGVCVCLRVFVLCVLCVLYVLRVLCVYREPIHPCVCNVEVSARA